MLTSAKSCAAAWPASTARREAAFSALGEAVEKTLQILINTLSFARVGAFALTAGSADSALIATLAYVAARSHRTQPSDRGSVAA